jgi:signal transduction histidine kinase
LAVDSPADSLKSGLARLAAVIQADDLESRAAASLLLDRLRDELDSLDFSGASRRDHGDLFLLAPQPYLITDSSGSIVEANLAAQSFLGSNARGLRRKPLIVFIVDAEAKRKFRQHLLHMIPSEVMSFECMMRPYGGLETDVVLSALKTIDRGGERILWLVRDLTDHIRAEKEVREAKSQLELRVEQRTSELQEALEQLTRANHAKDEFLGLMSHELRTPLTVIIGNARILKRAPQLVSEEDGQEVLNDIYNEAERLQRLIENLMVLAKLDGRTLSEPEPLLLQHILPEITSYVQTRYPTLNVKVSVSDQLPTIAGVPTYLELIFHNLLGNAAKYAGNPEIDICAESCGEKVRISVRDHGQGISEADAEHIFEPFFRATEARGLQSGAGIGLTVCRRLVEAQGGEIWVESALGDGTTFRFTVPVWD